VEAEMNERIADLAEQADQYAHENLKNESTWFEAYDSKFAELIIKECLSIADNRGAYQVMDDIIERFGVEL
jgi:hypothetical protein